MKEFKIHSVEKVSKVSQKSNVTYVNIAGRLPENSRNSFIDLQSQKTVKKTEKKPSFH